MSNLSTCPRCQRMVSLPEETDAATPVRCPLCHAEYPLSETLALVPPVLIVVPASEPVTASAAPPAPVPELAAESFFFEEPTVSPPVSPSGNDFLSVVEPPPHPSETLASDPAEDFQIDFEEHFSQPESPPAEQEVATEMPEITRDALEQSPAAEQPAPKSASDREFAPARPALPPRTRPLVKPLPPRPKRKKRGPIRLACEWIFGGCLSLLLAYVGIFWIRGESAGLPRLDWLSWVLPAEGYGALPPAAKPTPSKMNANTLPHAPESNAAAHTTAPAATPAKKAEVPAGSPSQADSTASNPAAAEVKNEKIAIPEIPKPAPPALGPRPPAEYNFYDLDNAILATTEALFGGKGTGKINAENYPVFCRLAEVLTYVAPERLAAPQNESVKSLLAKTVPDLLINLAKDPKQFIEIGRLAGEAVKNATEEAEKKGEGAAADGGHCGGILLAGKAANILSRNGLFGAVIKPADGSEGVSVVSAKPFRFYVGDDVLVAGEMIAHPKENLAGYPGKAALVIWQGTAIVVPQTAKTK